MAKIERHLRRQARETCRHIRDGRGRSDVGHRPRVTGLRCRPRPDRPRRAYSEGDAAGCGEVHMRANFEAEASRREPGCRREPAASSLRPGQPHGCRAQVEDESANGFLGLSRQSLCRATNATTATNERNVII